MSIRQYIPTDHLPQGSGVYKIVCAPTGEAYIGGTANVRKRGYQHAVLLTNGDHYAKLMQRAYRQYGARAFRIEVLDACELPDVSIREAAWIGLLKPVFNTRPGESIIRDSGVRQITGRPKGPSPKVTERNKRIVAEWSAGKSVLDLASEFALTVTTIRKTLLAAGISVRQHYRKVQRAEDVAAAVEAVRSGETISAAAKARNLPTEVISEACHSAGIHRRPGPRLGSTRSWAASVQQVAEQSASQLPN